MPGLPYEPPESPESKNNARHTGIPVIVYKIVGLILLILLVYWLWRTYTRLPAAQPIRYPAEYIPTLRLASLCYPFIKFLG
jgi:hypothetical protein